MRIPLLDLSAQNREIQPAIEAAALRVLREHRFILGPEVEAFEREVARFIGVNHAVGLSSGTDALLAALMALDLGSGDEVITTSYSFFATVGVIARVGARPVLVDIEEDGFQLDPEQVAARVGPRTRAIVAVHLFGRCCAIDRLRAIAPEVPVIEDAAQAIGATLDGRPAGSLGLAGCFSFFPSKNLGGSGDGGLLTTEDRELHDRILALRTQGQPPGRRNEHVVLGGNFRLDALQAAILRVKLERLEAWTADRRRNAQRYRELLAQSGAPVRLPPPEAPESRHVYNQFVIRTGRRDALRAHLHERGIGTAVYYPRSLHLQPCLAHLGYGADDFPRANRAAAENLALPVHPALTPTQLEEVVDRITTFLASS